MKNLFFLFAISLFVISGCMTTMPENYHHHNTSRNYGSPYYPNYFYDGYGYDNYGYVYIYRGGTWCRNGVRVNTGVRYHPQSTSPSNGSSSPGRSRNGGERHTAPSGAQRSDSYSRPQTTRQGRNTIVGDRQTRSNVNVGRNTDGQTGRANSGTGRRTDGTSARGSASGYGRNTRR